MVFFSFFGALFCIFCVIFFLKMGLFNFGVILGIILKKNAGFNNILAWKHMEQQILSAN